MRGGTLKLRNAETRKLGKSSETRTFFTSHQIEIFFGKENQFSQVLENRGTFVQIDLQKLDFLGCQKLPFQSISFTTGIGIVLMPRVCASQVCMDTHELCSVTCYQMYSVHRHETKRPSSQQNLCTHWARKTCPSETLDPEHTGCEYTTWFAEFS